SLGDPRLWDYLPYGPFADVEGLREHLARQAASEDPLFFAVVDAATGRDAANARSRRAAERFGFTFEGVFRQHQIVKGRNRDTAWYAMLDGEWPAIRAAFEAWLAPENFDESGAQRRSLEALRQS